ncbi:hypothetical protein BDD14_3867 [Edaphobacter modestus]|uniref:Uncharacterized protein n=1 Tax=Edaphobacter modestus TaxID=388466 RepID=A0A4V2G4U0_9BACT|nr:hypothetical protein BDD14_3867 [Edaphobacter modestus]
MKVCKWLAHTSQTAKAITLANTMARQGKRYSLEVQAQRHLSSTISCILGSLWRA